MKSNKSTPAGILHQIAEIERMEPGKLCVMRQGKKGPYYNHQWREDGKPVSRYVPSEEVEAVKENTENFRTFRRLVDDYAEQIITRTREERRTGQKKRNHISSDARKKSSKN